MVNHMVWLSDINKTALVPFNGLDVLLLSICFFENSFLPTNVKPHPNGCCFFTPRLGSEIPIPHILKSSHF